MFKELRNIEKRQDGIYILNKLGHVAMIPLELEEDTNISVHNIPCSLPQIAQGVQICFRKSRHDEILIPTLNGMMVSIDPIIAKEIENHLTSPYFITGIILNVCAVFGIWLGKEKSKIVFVIITIVLAVINTFPIICILLKI